jgi:hypothetical protein
MFSLATLFSCVKTGFTKDEQLSGLTRDALNQTDFLALTQAYSLLSSGEKENLWNVKFNAILTNDKNNLTTKQYDIVKKTYDFIKEKSYKVLEENPEIGDAFLDQNLPDFEKEFDKIELYMMLESPYYCDGFTLTKVQDYANSLENNIFNEGYQGTMASSCTCRYNMGCPGWTNDCNWGSGGCSQVNGCGLLGHSRCKGRCNLDPVRPLVIH